jgi:hypothetical protein
MSWELPKEHGLSEPKKMAYLSIHYWMVVQYLLPYITQDNTLPSTIWVSTTNDNRRHFAWFCRCRSLRHYADQADSNVQYQEEPSASTRKNEEECWQESFWKRTKHWRYGLLEAATIHALILGTPKTSQAPLKILWPLQSAAKIGNVAYKLMLPEGYSIHHVFHVSQIKKHIGPKVIPQANFPLTDSEGNIMVYHEKLLNRRMIPRNNESVIQWMIQWVNLPPTTTTWEDSISWGRSFQISVFGQGIQGGGIISILATWRLH